MYTTINEQHKDYHNFENDFINTFKKYDGIILIGFINQFKYKKFKDYYIKYTYVNDTHLRYFYLTIIEYFNYSGKLHREDKPAYIEYDKNGNIITKKYYLNGKLHREDGPAWINYHNGKIESKFYFFNGKRHREDGPAWMTYYENGKIRYKYYYLHNKQFSYKKYLKNAQCIQQ